MSKAPLANKPEAKRTDRRTRIAQGPAPLPPPVAVAAPKPTEEDDALSREKTTPRVKRPKKTQMIMGAPPLPPSLTGKTQIPTGPVPPAPRPTPPPKEVSKPIPQDFAQPSRQETAVGPAPAPPVPKPVKPSSSTETMEMMMELGGLFDDFENEVATQLHGSGPISLAPDADAPPKARAKSPSVPMPPPRPVSGPAPRASKDRDTLTTAELRGTGPTNPPVSEVATADTQVDFKLDSGRQTADEHTYSRDERRTTAVRAGGRENRVGTAMRGMEGLSAPSADAPKIRLVPGKKIPGTRYEIRRWLGEGGMGVVYEVIHTDIERRSALKILRFDLSHQPQMAQVFRDEARAASRLGSPYIVEVYDFGELPDGRLYFAMELLEGVDLVPVDEETCMEPARLIGILRQVCKGLSKAHDAGVVHRDVKPENIIVVQTEEGRTDSVKVVDFGISAMLAAGEKKAGIAGTPHYMAPEQILGEDFDGRLDIYALGCTAYELMVGVPPFDSEEVDELLKMQVKSEPRPPREVRPDLGLPAELEAVVMKCLAKKPEQRFPNMAQLEAALCEAQIAAGITTAWDDLPVPVLPDTERYERIVARMPSVNQPQPARRGWLWPVVAGVSTLAAAGLAGYLMFGRQPTDEERDRVEQLTIEARAAASKAAWVLPPPHVEGTTTALRKIVELEDVEGLAETMADERAGELRHEFATTLIGYGDDLWEEAKNISRQYYVWSLTFEDDNERAQERAGVDAVAIGRFRAAMEAGEFSATDILMAAPALMTVADEQDKEAIAAAVQKGIESEDMAPVMLAQFTKDAESAGMKLGGPKRGSGAKSGRGGAGGRNPAATRRPPEPEPEPDVGDDEGLVLEEDPEEDPAAAASRKKRRRQVDMGLDGKAKFNPKRSHELTKQADTMRKKGLRNEAKDLYAQAIAANPKNGLAHLGMAQVHFDQASYDKARKSALNAVKHAPRSGRAHKVLGDAYYKAFRYEEAEAAYVKAQNLGVSVGKRLTDVRAKLGK